MFRKHFAAGDAVFAGGGKGVTLGSFGLAPVVLEDHVEQTDQQAADHRLTGQSVRAMLQGYGSQITVRNLRSGMYHPDESALDHYQH